MVTHRRFHPEHDMAKQPAYVQDYIQSLLRDLQYYRETIDTLKGENENTECFWTQTIDIPRKLHPLPANSNLIVALPAVDGRRNHELTFRKAFMADYGELSISMGRIRIEPRATNLVHIYPDYL